MTHSSSPSIRHTAIGTCIAWVQICRPLIVFISVFGAMVGALNVRVASGSDVLSGWTSDDLRLLYDLILGAALLSAGLMIHNDVTDFPSDMVNRPHKPLPRGAIRPGTARWTGIVTMVAAVIIAGLHHDSIGSTPWNPACGLLTAVIVITGIFYNDRGKMHGIIGHWIVAFGVGAIPLWGALQLSPENGYLLVPLAFSICVMEVGREIMVCVGDMPGDREAGFRTTPLRLGRGRAMKLAMAYYIAYAFLLPLPYTGIGSFEPIFGHVYVIGATLFECVLLFTWWRTWVAIRRGNEDDIFQAFERHIRLGTRLAVVGFQGVLLLEAFV